MIPLLTEDRALAVVRAPRIDDPVALARALADGGIRVVELTFTTPGVTDLVRAAVDAGCCVGCGTVTSRSQAEQAIDAGARFLVTPGLGPDAAGVVTSAHAARVPVMLGAMTPSEVMSAVALGADLVKIFPAGSVGPRHLADLLGPFPDVDLVPSGGIDESNAADYLAAGALAVTAGSSVVDVDDVTHGRWDAITGKAARFVAALGKAHP